MAVALIKIGREMDDDLLAGTRRLGMFQGHAPSAPANSSGWWLKTAAIVISVVVVLILLFFCGKRWLNGPSPPGNGGGDDASEWRRLHGLCRTQAVKASIGNIIASISGSRAATPSDGQPAAAAALPSTEAQDPNFTPI